MVIDKDHWYEIAGIVELGSNGRCQEIGGILLSVLLLEEVSCFMYFFYETEEGCTDKYGLECGANSKEFGAFIFGGFVNKEETKQ